MSKYKPNVNIEAPIIEPGPAFKALVEWEKYRRREAIKNLIRVGLNPEDYSLWDKND